MRLSGKTRGSVKERHNADARESACPPLKAIKAPARAVILAALVALASLANGRESAYDPAAELMKAGELVRKGSWSTALATGRDILKNTADPLLQGRAQLLAGYCEYQLKHYESARKMLREASGLYPALSFHGLYYGALSFQEQADYPEAVKLWEKLIKSNPPGDLAGRALMELLRSHRRSKDPEAAAKTLERIEALTDKQSLWDYELTYTRGWVKLNTGAGAEARKILVNLWKNHPDSFWADQAANLINGDDAILMLLPGESSLISDGDRVQRIKILIEKNRPDQALSELEPIIEKAEQGSPLSRLAGLYKVKAAAHHKKREFKAAIAEYKKSQSLREGEDHEITYNIAECLRRSGLVSEALETYGGLWARYPKGTFATRCLFYMARLQKLTNDWGEAEKNYKKIVSDYPRSTLRAESLFLIAWIRFLDRDYAKARAYLDRVPAKRKDREFNARTLYWKAVCLHKLGQHTAAREIENKILAEHWKTSYAFYLVMLGGSKWPYKNESKAMPAPETNPPIEYRIARELYYLGLEGDAQGLLDNLQQQGKMPESLAWEVAKMYYSLGDYHASQRIAYKSLNHRLKTPPPGEPGAWRMAYPRAFNDLVTSYAKERSLDPFLVWSVMRAESTYRPEITSWAGAVGLMQVMPGTGKQIARGLGEKGFKKSWLNDPDVSVRYGCYYLYKRMDQFNNGGPTAQDKLEMITRALAAYNAGPERSTRWGERADLLGLAPDAFVEEIPIKETRNYVKRILRFYLIYLTAYPGEQTNTQTSNPNPSGG